MKIFIQGAKGCGKSHLMQCYTEDGLPEHQTHSMGVGYRIHDIDWGTTSIELELFDNLFPSNEDFLTHPPRGRDHDRAILVVFDLTDRASFEDAMKQCAFFKKYSSNIILVGNKTDAKEHQIIGYDEVNTFAQSRGIPIYFVSAETGEGVNDLFINTTKQLIGKEKNT